jgi:hypothetical protein
MRSRRGIPKEPFRLQVCVSNSWFVTKDQSAVAVIVAEIRPHASSRFAIAGD